MNRVRIAYDCTAAIVTLAIEMFGKGKHPYPGSVNEGNWVVERDAEHQVSHFLGTPPQIWELVQRRVYAFPDTVQYKAGVAGYAATEAGYQAAARALADAEDDLVRAVEQSHSIEGHIRARIKELQDFVWSWEREHRGVCT